ncbi:alpha/beta fold hydrolase [Nocardia sp. NPDC058176]|uniref:alpha/beta fold hydrolase n=1 Tax=Nocardia sp. NPDC058176 TaxID=3346368 RepID=UPI0036D90966
MGKLAIETRGLKKSFGKTHAVAGVDLAVSAGGVYGVRRHQGWPVAPAPDRCCHRPHAAQAPRQTSRTEMCEMNEMAFRVTSNDGTTIAYDREGSGPAVILVGGALDGGVENAPLAPTLAERFTVYNYARRGRGASGFTEPYAVEREIEDLDALIAEAGGSAHLFGASSGGALALEAAAAGSAIDTIAVWEVPYAVGDDIRPRFEEYIADTRRAFDAGRDEEVLELFMRMTGASDDNIAARKAAGKQTAHWADSVALAPTLVHDSVFLNRYRLPADRLATVTQPVLVTTGGPITVPYMAGLPSDFFDRAADELADQLPHVQRETLEVPDHVVDPQTVGPLLLRFFSTEH